MPPRRFQYFQTKKITEEEEILQTLEKHGFSEITEKDKKQFWYKQDLEKLERWRREELGKPFTVSERKALYSTKQTKSAKVKI